MTNHHTATSDAVKRALKDRGITQSDAGVVLGLDQTSLSRRYTGQIPWRLNELEDLADHLAIPVHELLQPRADQPEVVDA